MLPAVYRRWSPTWNANPEEFDAVRECFANPGSLDAAFGYYRKLSPIPSASLKARITVPTVVFAGLDDLRPFLRRLAEAHPQVLIIARADVRGRLHH